MKWVSADVSIVLLSGRGGGGGGCMKPNQDVSDWTFQTYRGTYLYYDILYDPTSSGI